MRRGRQRQSGRAVLGRGAFRPATLRLGAVGSAPTVRATQTIPLHTAGVRCRYYLVWITSLGNHAQVDVNEIALYTQLQRERGE